MRSLTAAAIACVLTSGCASSWEETPSTTSTTTAPRSTGSTSTVSPTSTLSTSTGATSTGSTSTGSTSTVPANTVAPPLDPSDPDYPTFSPRPTPSYPDAGR